MGESHVIFDLFGDLNSYSDKKIAVKIIAPPMTSPGPKASPKIRMANIEFTEKKNKRLTWLNKNAIFKLQSLN